MASKNRHLWKDEAEGLMLFQRSGCVIPAFEIQHKNKGSKELSCVHSNKNYVNLLFPPSLFPLSFPSFSAAEPTAVLADPVEAAGQNYPWNITPSYKPICLRLMHTKI